MRSSLLLLISLLISLLLAPLLATPLRAEEDEDAPAERIAAGEEDGLEIPGSDFPCQLYVPSDYVQGVRLPLIFFLHGSGGKPTCWPWKSATGGKGYLIVGLSYGALPQGGHRGIQSDPVNRTAMVKFIEQVRALVHEQYGIDQRRVFLSGLSMGGWGVNFYGFLDEARGRYRGYCIMAAGIVQSPAPDLSVIEGLPLLLLNGANDANLAAANRGKPLFKKAGALVEQVVLQDEGHVPSTAGMAKPLKAWLDEIQQADEQERALAAVKWQAVELDGWPEPGGSWVAALLAWLKRQPFLEQATGKPALLFLTTDHPGKNGAPSKQAGKTERVEAEAFGYPAACETPAAARSFACLRASIAAVDKQTSARLYRDFAPLVLLVDRDRTALRVLAGGKLRDAALAKELRALLTAEELAAADARVAETKPVLVKMRKLRKSIRSEKKTLAKLRRKDAKSKKVRLELMQHTVELESMIRYYDKLQAKLAE